MTNEDFNLTSNWFNGTIIPPQVSVSSKECLDASQSTSVASQSVTFSNPLVNDNMDPVSIPITMEGQTSFSDEGQTSVSEEVRTSTPEEGHNSVLKEVLVHSEEGGILTSEEAHPPPI